MKKVLIVMLLCLVFIAGCAPPGYDFSTGEVNNSSSPSNSVKGYQMYCFQNGEILFYRTIYPESLTYSVGEIESAIFWKWKNVKDDNYEAIEGTGVACTIPLGR